VLARRPPPHPPGPGQESVWDYPRPPRVEPARRPVEVRTGGLVLARSQRAVRVCETASPPTYYLPPDDVDTSRLVPGYGRSTCEWKGEARYWTAVLDDASASAGGGAAGGGARIDNAAWSYPEPEEGYESLAGWYAFYPAAVECYVGDERVRPQEGGFYGGWVTGEIVGPWKGGPGTGHW
jgi:uncharacterized protein (DUF427 family)